MEILDEPTFAVEPYFSNQYLKGLLLFIIVLGFLAQGYLMVQEYQQWIWEKEFRMSIINCFPTAYYHYYSGYIQGLGITGLLISLYILKKSKWKFPTSFMDRVIFWSPVLLLVVDRILMKLVKLY